MGPYSLRNLKKLLVNDKITALCQTNMSPKHNLSPYKQQKGTLKTVSLTSFRKPPNAICFNLLLQVYPSVLPSIFVVINTSFFLRFEWLFLCCSQFGGSSLCLNS